MFFFFFVFLAQAQPLNRNMAEVATTLRGLVPFMVSPARFSDPASQKEIAAGLERMEELFRQNRTHFLGKEESRQVVREIMLETLAETRRQFARGSKPLARQMLKSVPELCLNCHTQDQFSARILKGVPEVFGSDLETAEFHLVTRRPDQAEKYLSAFLATPDKRSPDGLARALTDELRLAIHRGRDWTWIRKRLAERKQALPRARFGSLISQWEEGVALAEKTFAGSPRTVGALGAAVTKALNGDPGFGLMADGPQVVLFTKLRAEVLKLLSAGLPERDLPEAFYWLSLSERATGYDAFYSLADAYLRACITRWPDQPYARKCFEEYEEFVEFGYSGSSGTHIPDDVKQELERLRKMIAPKPQRKVLR